MAEEGQEAKPQESSLGVAPKAADEKNEDIPPDFFDDFLKDDFMAGLDIVDEDLEDNITNEETNRESKPPEKAKEQVKKSEEPKKKVKKPSKRDEELKQLDKELDEIRNKVSKKPDNKSKLDVDNFDIRRDPEKTRQAIQQDKIKSAKKLINDIVETGLVPPGMELEVDMAQVKYQPKIRDLREKLRPRNLSADNPKKSRRRSKTPSKKPSKTPSKKRSKTPTKKRSKSPPRKRSKSPLTLRPRNDELPRPRRSRSRPRMTRSRTRSPPRIHSPLMPRRPRLLSPSPPRRRLRRTRSPSLTRRRSRSPSLTRRRSRSPIFNRSWRRRRSPSYSPRRKMRRSRSRSPKPSFLEEIAAKLNCKLNYMPQQQFQGNNQVYGNLVPMAPMPVPAMPPQAVPHQEVHFFVPPLPQEQPPPEPYDPFDQYDESFFIGAPIKKSPTVSRQESAPQRNDVGQLFNDKRIQLSDFLAITAKPALSSTASTKLSDKVKVIRRAQDAIKELSQPFCHGSLFVRRTDALQSPEVNVSPLNRKKASMPFFAPDNDNMLADMEFPTCCETLLSRVGLAKRFDRAEVVHRKSVSPPPVPS
ncbi:unnamed protein product [Ceutorhynchus assimilis]|uniref:Uncharacterized protein n=1 Tax=Ceutorhynchus assimilis TaxID=467358 RepID=A0A9N9MLD5_9CUCU|nr:unnamed protein product [Ceutorhynchus assimilis]